MNAICHMLTKVECSHFKKSYLFVCLFACLFLEWRERGEKHQCVVVSHAPPTGDMACNPGMCPEWESNW